jgi:nucleotidyltransferase/DNA polymerase involved in DNA repair
MNGFTPSRPVICNDADCCFASIEQSRNPEYRGKPLITGKERGIVASMSLEAKALGITCGMRLFEVKRSCPDAIILPPDYETYRIYSKRMFAIVRRFTPDVEEYSIDECFADLTGLRRPLRMSYVEMGQKSSSCPRNSTSVRHESVSGPAVARRPRLVRRTHGTIDP